MAKLEYDESGGTFTYFLVLLYGFFLLVVSYFLWPGLGRDDGKGKLVCHCGPCCRKKTKLEAQAPFKKLKWFLRILVLAVMWAFLLYLIYWAVTQEREFIEWDPYEVLQLDHSASVSEIKKQYRKLSKLYHPDKEGGNQELFMKIAKAYEALTDEESRENWEKYGNPDGPQAATFGIALPAWIVDKQNSIWVLGLYVLVFMVGLPIVVGTWWYRSVKFGNTNVLIETTRIFMYLLSRAKTIPIKRIHMSLAAARELSNKAQAGVNDRPSDNIHLNLLVKQLPQVKVDTREPPFNRPSVAKARLLLHAYLEHVEIQDPGLISDQDSIIKYSPYLINEMINVLGQLWGYAKMYEGQKGSRGKKLHEPTAEMFENVMRLNQMLVQAIHLPFQSLWQLPHIKESNPRFVSVRKKKRITSVEEFASLRNEERRRILRGFSDEEYQDVMVFLNNFPHIEMEVSTEVADDEDTSVVTAGSLTTVVVYLKRMGLLEYYKTSLDELLADKKLEDDSHHYHDNHLDNEDNEIPIETIGSDSVENDIQKSPKSAKSNSGSNVRSNKKKKKGRNMGGGGSKPNNKKRKPVKPVGKDRSKEPSEEREEEMKERESGADDDLDNNGDVSMDDEDKEWKELQEAVKKDKEKDTNVMSHPVHAPFFPADKQELWWLYIVNRRVNKVVLPPQKVVGLEKEKTVRLQLMAPDRGNYRYSVVLMSDSYVNLFVQQELKLQVHEKKEVSGKEQWADLEKEEEEEDMIEESVTESEESDDED